MRFAPWTAGLSLWGSASWEGAIGCLPPLVEAPSFIAAAGRSAAPVTHIRGDVTTCATSSDCGG